MTTIFFLFAVGCAPQIQPSFENSNQRFIEKTISKLDIGKELEGKIGDFNEFLKQMDIVVNVKKADSFSIPRISQLTLKTNQFNLTTRRYQEEEVSKFSTSDDKIVECVQVSDKFGDNGLVAVIIAERKYEFCNRSRIHFKHGFKWRPCQQFKSLSLSQCSDRLLYQ